MLSIQPREFSVEVAHKTTKLLLMDAVEVDLKLSPRDRELLRHLRVERELLQCEAFGMSEGVLEAHVGSFVSKMGPNKRSDVAHLAWLIAHISSCVQEGFGQESAWTCLRVSLPHQEFDVPRWHPDGQYFTSEKKVHKFVTTLKGASTLFGEVEDYDRYQLLKEEESRLNSLYETNRDAYREASLRIRRELMEVVRQTDIGAEGKGVVYMVGHPDAVVHSEPLITQPRIFLSVLPGSKRQIAEWKNSIFK